MAKIGAVPYSAVHGVSPCLFCPVARVQRGAADMFSIAAGARQDLRANLAGVTVKLAFELRRVVVGSYHNVAALIACRIEPVVMDHPTPDRVIARIDLPHQSLPSDTVPALSLHMS